jgi:hypothetical protein
MKFGVQFPTEFVKKLDAYKGYYSRNKFILKLLEEHWSEIENRVNHLKIVKEETEPVVSGDQG